MKFTSPHKASYLSCSYLSTVYLFLPTHFAGVRLELRLEWLVACSNRQLSEVHNCFNRVSLDPALMISEHRSLSLSHLSYHFFKRYLVRVEGLGVDLGYPRKITESGLDTSLLAYGSSKTRSYRIPNMSIMGYRH